LRNAFAKRANLLFLTGKTNFLPVSDILIDYLNNSKTMSKIAIVAFLNCSAGINYNTDRKKTKNSFSLAAFTFFYRPARRQY